MISLNTSHVKNSNLLYLPTWRCNYAHSINNLLKLDRRIQGVRKKGYLVKKPTKVLCISMQILKFLRFSILNKLIVVSIYITIQTLVMAFNEVAFFPGHLIIKKLTFCYLIILVLLYITSLYENENLKHAVNVNVLLCILINILNTL